jgi:hypothetical protein
MRAVGGSDTLMRFIFSSYFYCSYIAFLIGGVRRDVPDR